MLPCAPRSASGYRVHDETHVLAANAYRQLALGCGPTEARRLMQLVGTGSLEDLLAGLDSGHARLAVERRALSEAKAAAEEIVEEPLVDVRPSDVLTISELAAALGVRASTLRHWEAVGLLAPDRDSARARAFRPQDVRDARIVHQLRQAGYRIAELARLMPDLRGGGDRASVLAGLDARDASVVVRSRALLTAAAAIVALQDVLESRS